MNRRKKQIAMIPILAILLVSINVILSASALAAPLLLTEENIALNPGRTGFPHPLESDDGWGGGSDKWEIVDGLRTYPDWAHGLAFTGGIDGWGGEACGERQATISFGEQEKFSKVIIWHHGLMHIPEVSNLQYWNGLNWVDITFFRDVNLSDTWSSPETLTFDPVEGSKVKYSFNNCENDITGVPMEHGWIYEFEVFAGISNLILNYGFESGTAPWIFYTNGKGSFTTVSPGYEGNRSARLAIISAGNNTQLYQKDITLEPNTRYRLSFEAYSTSGHDLSVNLIKHGSPYTSYGLAYTANLGTSWQTFSTEFTTKGFIGTVNDGRLMFGLAQYGAAGDSYYIDAIILEKVGADTSPPIVTGNTPTGTGVPVTTKISVTFNESMNQTSAQTAFLTSPSTAGSLSWSGNMMTYTPTSLSAMTTYTVNIGTGAKDLAGNSLQSPYIWSFTTSNILPCDCLSIEARLASLEANMTALKTRVTELEAENTALKGLLAGVSRNGNDLYIDGANLHVRDGSGDTEGPTNGLGNLIIGYNELRGSMDNRTGSHNLILGRENNYGSYGGIVAGSHNEISGPYSSVSGGWYNKASGLWSSVSGGGENTASGPYSSVSGGSGNTASGWQSSVSGGGGNTASDEDSAVSGGNDNTASGPFSSVSGGVWNRASGLWSSVSGGNNNIASGNVSSVSGGLINTASGENSAVSGGSQRNAMGIYDWVAGGLFQDQ